MTSSTTAGDAGGERLFSFDQIPEQLRVAAIQEAEPFITPILVGNIWQGSATFVRVGTKCGLLTAAHVWTGVRESGATAIGLVVTTGAHRFEVPVETIQAVFLKEVIPHAFFQPDIAFLEFTPRDIARIESHRKSFYRIGDRSRSMDSMTQFPGPYVWVAGFPQEFVVPNAEVYQEEPVRLVRGGLEVAPDRYVAGSPFDYLVVRIPSGVDGAAQTYQGVSGAGVWGFYFRHDRKTGEISSEPPEFALIGVAFHEGPLEKNQREICCHGAGSIHVTLPGELQNPQT